VIADSDTPADARITAAFEACPAPLRKKALQLRKIVLQTAADKQLLNTLEETLKWGEPSYVVKGGSTVRIGWKAGDKPVLGLYFNCNSKLVDTFREIHGETFTYQGNRGLQFTRGDRLPVRPLKACIGLALQYHKVKHLPLLGATPA